jgi:hypothetical protein
MINPKAFERFRWQMRKRESNHNYQATRGTKVGAYQFSRDRLVDLGFMEKLRAGSRIRYRWRSPWSRKKFLADEAGVQDFAFRLHVEMIVRRLHRKPNLYLLGLGYDLSGLVGVVHLLGWTGMKRWVKANAKQREKMVDGLGTPGLEYYQLLKGYALIDSHRRET